MGYKHWVCYHNHSNHTALPLPPPPKASSSPTLSQPWEQVSFQDPIHPPGGSKWAARTPYTPQVGASGLPGPQIPPGGSPLGARTPLHPQVGVSQLSGPHTHTPPPAPQPPAPLSSSLTSRAAGQPRAPPAPQHPPYRSLCLHRMRAEPDGRFAPSFAPEVLSNTQHWHSRFILHRITAARRFAPRVSISVLQSHRGTKTPPSCTRQGFHKECHPADVRHHQRCPPSPWRGTWMEQGWMRGLPDARWGSGEVRINAAFTRSQIWPREPQQQKWELS